MAHPPSALPQHVLAPDPLSPAQNHGEVPLTYGQFCKVIGTPAAPLEAPASIPGPGAEGPAIATTGVPTLTELGYDESQQVRAGAEGGPHAGWQAQPSTSILLSLVHPLVLRQGRHST